MRISPSSLGLMHFIGIGGIGMSGIAVILHSLGYKVQGSDCNNNANVNRLKKLGIKCYIGHNVTHLENVNVVIISSDIPNDNIELIAARGKKIPIVRRADMLAEIMRLRPSIAIAGTHGKTTTTSLGAAVLEAGKIEPTVISGGIINQYGTNARLGKGEWTIVEADESDGTFVNLPATHAIVTNIDPEHMNYYGNFNTLYQSFKKFIENIPFYGLGIVCFDHPATRQLSQEITDRRIITYGLEDGSDVQAINVHLCKGMMHFDVKFSEYFKKTITSDFDKISCIDFELNMIGAHNVQNALTTIVYGLEIGLDINDIKRGLKNFKGVKRRFTSIGQWQGQNFIDDYAHHPTEVKVVLEAARLSNDGPITAVFQPHRYTRLNNFLDEFMQVLKEFDTVYITPVYSAGEQMDNIDHLSLAQLIQTHKHNDVFIVNSPAELSQRILNSAASNGYTIFMGAGDITNWVVPTLEALENNSTHPVSYA